MGSLFPFSSSGPIGSAATASRTKLKVSSPITISPASAACSKRAATLTASPVTMRSGPDPGHNLARVDADPDLQLGAGPATALGVQCREHAAHVVGRAHRPEGVILMDTRVPKTARTASPMNFSTVPPCRSTAARISSK